MALRDYAELDEEDFYGQDFEKEGIVSLWAGLTDNSSESEDLDVLQDLCGIGYYRLDNQESMCDEFVLRPLEKLIADFSYVDSFRDSVISAAKKLNIHEARWVVAQCDFEYDPNLVKRTIQPDPIVLGSFPYARAT